MAAEQTTDTPNEARESEGLEQDTPSERALGERAFELAIQTTRQLADKREALLAEGVPADLLVEYLWSDDVIPHVGELVRAGASAEAIITALGRGWVKRDGVAKLLEAGTPVADLLPFLTTKERVSQAPLLSEYGLPFEEVIDTFTTADIVANLPALAENRTHLDGLFDRCEPRAVAGHLDVFTAAGVVIDFDRYLPHLTREDIGQHLESILAAGAPADHIVERLDPWDLNENVDQLLLAGANPELILKRLARASVASHITALGEAGVPVGAILERLIAWDVSLHLEELTALGVDPDTVAPLLAARELTRPKNSTIWLQ